ncbi:MAG: protein-L-isoaspartate(D-aspartate) O-methyltransferase [Saprospiraceae bacterium]
MNLKDTTVHKGLRRRLVRELREMDIKDERVLQAIEIIPRHFFVDSTFLSMAYENKPLPIGNEQTISQPYTVAYQTELLDVQPREKVLEIGTGSGYQAAILATLGAKLYTVERHEGLYLHAKELLRGLGLGNIKLSHRDGYEGLPRYAPFDKIIVTAAAPKIPKVLCEQLAIGGMMVVPIGKRTQYMYKIERLSETKFRNEKLGKFQFVPFIKGTT